MAKKGNKELAAKLPSLKDVLDGEKPWKGKGLRKGESLAIRRYYVDLLRLDGRTAFAISRLLGIPDSDVRRDFKALDEENAINDITGVRGVRRGEIYRRLLRVAEKAEDQRKRAILDGALREANGALAIELDALERVGRLFGLEVTKLEHSGPDGGPIATEGRDTRLDAILGAASDDKLQKLVDLLGVGDGSPRSRGGRRAPTAGR